MKHQSLPPVVSRFHLLKTLQLSPIALPAEDGMAMSYGEHLAMKPQQEPSTFLFEIRPLIGLEQHHVGQDRLFTSSQGPSHLHLLFASMKGIYVPPYTPVYMGSRGP